jgi:glycosyltransferase involved in cell wall biosynthesis
MPALLDVAMVQALEQRKVPFVAIVHDADLHPGDGLWPQMMLQDRMARSAHGLVALSDHVARALRRRYGPDKPLEVMYHAPFTFDRPSVGPARFPRQREGRLLFFGRLLPYKGLDLLAEAMVLLQDRMRIELAIHGAGAIERRVRARLARIRHLTLEEGWIAEERIPDLILAADAVVAPYREASQSGVVPIAYAYGRPVVATPVGGLAEQVVHGETGLVAASVTPGALAAAIERLFTDEGLYTHCAETAVRHAAQRLTWQNFASTLYRFCGSVAPAADVAA